MSCQVVKIQNWIVVPSRVMTSKVRQRLLAVTAQGGTGYSIDGARRNRMWRSGWRRKLSSGKSACNGRRRAMGNAERLCARSSSPSSVCDVNPSQGEDEQDDGASAEQWGSGGATRERHWRRRRWSGAGGVAQ
ncbi:hypothetical protein U1Q18_036794, partial [Sarracenia purpurea var. burkii]